LEECVTGRRRAVLIAGPTASGKSALALAMARQQGGIVVNVDAMQIYDVLQVVTARPSDAEMALAEHRLYGTVPASVRFSTGQWLNAVRDVMAEADPARPLIFVGGTGLYFDALLNGFADIPEVPAEVTLQVQQEIQSLDGEQRLALLLREDPETAERLGVVDPQRLTRALAVKRATGHRLSHFQNRHAASFLADFLVERMVLDPDRQVLRERIALRFDAMFNGGAVEEVKTLLALDLDPSLPVMKAIGVREIGDWLDGVAGRDEAITLATIATHQYAKRQRTWFRNRFGDWPRRGIGGA
jgi:tRNA dimethylallyltransferase